MHRLLACSLVCALLPGCGGSGTGKTTTTSPEKSMAAAARQPVGVWVGEVTPTIGGDAKAKPLDPIPVRMEFRAGGDLAGEMFFPLVGTWKLAKAEGDKLTLDVKIQVPDEIGPDGAKVRWENDTFVLEFSGDDAITVTSLKEPAEKLKLKRTK